MSRCKACNRKMTEQELCKKCVNNITGKLEYTELCFHCSYETELDVRELISIPREEVDE